MTASSTATSTVQPHQEKRHSVSVTLTDDRVGRVLALLVSSVRTAPRTCGPCGYYTPDRVCRVTMEQLAALAHIFYLGRAAPDFERASQETIRAALDAAGLTGPFWELPTH